MRLHKALPKASTLNKNTAVIMDFILCFQPFSESPFSSWCTSHLHHTPSVLTGLNASDAFLYLTRSKKISIHIQARSAVRVPTQGAWKVWLKDVVVMSTEVGFMKRKGTHNH